MRHSDMMRLLRPKVRRIGPAIVICVLLVGGGSIFWFGLQAFRSHADEQIQKSGNEFLQEEALEDALQGVPGIATLFSSSGEVGRAVRVLNAGVATIDILITLPAVDTSVYEYHVWLVKNGLADVVDVGALVPRADGTWTGVFIAGPATGVVDPMLFSGIVIMLEPRDGDEAPSGMKVSEGKW